MLDNAQVLFEADLSNPAMPGWEWWDETHSVVTTDSGTLIFNKEPSGGTQILSQYGLKKNEACLALFQYTGNSDLTFQAVSGNWWDSTWRVWGISGLGTEAFSQLEQIYNSASFGLKKISEHWYYNLLWVKGETTFVTRVWDKDDPQVYKEKQLNMIDASNWADGRVWNCHISVNSGLLEMGSYQELRFNQTP